MNTLLITFIIVLVLVIIHIIYMNNRKYIENFEHSNSSCNNKIPAGSWQTSCTDYKLIDNGSILVANCLDDNKNYVKSAIALDSCGDNSCNISNINGKLSCENSHEICTGLSGTWDQSCIDPTYSRDGKTLYALCQKRDGTYIRSSIDISTCQNNGCIAYNDDGNFKCGHENQNNLSNYIQSNLIENISYPAKKRCSDVSGTWKDTCKDFFFNPLTVTKNLYKTIHLI